VQSHAKILSTECTPKESGPSQVAGPYNVANEAKPDPLGLDEERNDQDNSSEYTRVSLR